MWGELGPSTPCAFPVRGIKVALGSMALSPLSLIWGGAGPEASLCWKPPKSDASCSKSATFCFNFSVSCPTTGHKSPSRAAVGCLWSSPCFSAHAKPKGRGRHEGKHLLGQILLGVTPGINLKQLPCSQGSHLVGTAA